MRARMIGGLLLVVLSLVSIASAKDKAFTMTDLYMLLEPSLKLNAGAYDKIIQVSSNSAAWCKAGYNPAADAELVTGAFAFTASNPMLTEDVATKQTQMMRTGIVRYFTENNVPIKNADGKHALDVSIVRSERSMTTWKGRPYFGWLLAAEVKITDETGNVLFRAVLNVDSNKIEPGATDPWQDGPGAWTKDFAKFVAKNGPKFSNGFGIDAGTSVK